jgi:protein-disulfide isomerase
MSEKLKRLKNSTDPTSDSSKTVKRSPFYFAIMPLIFLAGLGLGYLLWESPISGLSLSSKATEIQPTNTSQPVTRYDVPVGTSPYIGPEDAVITLIEFSDYQCTYCKQWFRDVYPQIMSAYAGKIRFVYKDFPLSSIHTDAFPAAEAAYCAGEQGKYWAFHEKLLSGELTLGADTYNTYASDLTLDLASFKECIDTNRYYDDVENNYEFAYNLGVRSTPTFFINGLAVVGAQSFDVFKQLIDQELAGQIP